ncbi:Disease resistance protein [Actinidia chinensis var. chinensis]|uniref:Disease resistance protein n=1 Tax=Actinidia chinensis var. chinensis TaxID=1590841 RepID=A0A2R6Q6M6_ACTCC|nr:Disease resistance protein [Actinidia chinensis var. chinensis]
MPKKKQGTLKVIRESAYEDAEKSENMEARSMAIAREGARWEMDTDTDMTIDARADDFIARFQEQLKLERLASSKNYNEMRGRRESWYDNKARMDKVDKEGGSSDNNTFRIVDTSLADSSSSTQNLFKGKDRVTEAEDELDANAEGFINKVSQLKTLRRESIIREEARNARTRLADFLKSTKTLYKGKASLSSPPSRSKRVLRISGHHEEEDEESDGGDEAVEEDDEKEKSTSFWEEMTLKMIIAFAVFILKLKAIFDINMWFRLRPQIRREDTEISMRPTRRDLPEVHVVEETVTPLDQSRMKILSELYKEGPIVEMISPFDRESLTTTRQRVLSPAEKEIAKEWEGMIQKAELLIRKKDFLHLILSYPMKPEAVEDVDFQFLRGLFSHMNQQVRILQALKVDNNLHDKHGREAIKIGIDEEDFQAIENSLSKYDFHMVAYLPQEAATCPYETWRERIEVGLTFQTNGTFEAPEETLMMAIDFGIRQVSKCIEDGSLQRIGISGSEGEKLATALKDIPMIRAKCSIILGLSVSQDHNTKEVELNIADQICGIQEIDEAFKGSLDQLLPQNFFLLLDCADGKIDLHDLNIPDHGIIVLTTRSQNVYEIMDVDLEIRMEDHLLPWKLFCRYVGSSLVSSSSAIQQMAVWLVKECHGHLLAIILLARALKDVTDSGVWKMALHELTSQSFKQVQGTSDVMVRVLNFIWDRKDNRTKHCINHFLLIKDRQRGDSLVSDWIANGLAETEAEGKGILEDLINSFFLENDGEGYVRMREETEIVLQNCYAPYLPSLYLRQKGLRLTETPQVKNWDALEIDLTDNELSELPENPKCPALRILRLHNNYDLMEIPLLFFEDMPALQALDLSFTSITCLPPSISRLVSLRAFNLKGCELLMELPPEIGALKCLEVFDLDGTEIMYLPKEIGELTSLKCLSVSLCGRANRFKVTKQMGTTIPAKVLSKLSQLVALSIDVNPDSEWWDADVRAILNELSCLKWLTTLELYLPSVDLLQQLRWDNGYLMYPDLLRFRVTVGHHPRRIISRLPNEVEVILKKWEKSKKCLKYVNGEGTPTEITEALNHASIFFLDRHSSVEMLSQFGNENMVKLEFCLLVECNELRTVIDGDYKCPDGVDKKPVFGCLRYLGIHYMKSLQSIWKCSIDEGCLTNLRTLALHRCPSLTTIFTLDLLGNLDKLEEVIVEDCPKIKSLVCWEFSELKPCNFLQGLKKISLLDLPELVSISGGLSIGPILESLIVYNCPKLESLYKAEVSSINLKIKGDEVWWDVLNWHESAWSSSTPPAFEKLGRGEDLMDQLAKEVYSH